MPVAPTLVVLAAGAGRRFGGPKQLAPVGPAGETLLEYAAFDAARGGFERVVLVVRADTEAAFRDRLDTTMCRRLDVRYVHQESYGSPGQRSKPWGTGHAALAVQGVVRGPFACVNADDFYGRSSYRPLGEFLRGVEDGRELAAVGFPLAETLTEAGPVSRALLEIDDRGRLRHLEELLEVWSENGVIVSGAGRNERRRFGGVEPVSMNMWGLTPSFLSELERRFQDFAVHNAGNADAEFRLPEIVDELVDEGLVEVRVLAGSNTWCGMTYREDLGHVRSTVRSLVASGEYPSDLWA